MKQTANNQGQIIANFYTVCQAELVNFAISRLGNREESEDLVHDVFISHKQVRAMLSMAM